MGDKPTFLFASPSFVEGMARTIDIGCTLQVYNGSNTGDEADSLAIRKDWEAVGGDIKKACKDYGNRK